MKQFFQKNNDKELDVKGYMCPEECNIGCSGYCAKVCEGSCTSGCANYCDGTCKGDCGGIIKAIFG
ncbi:hypothetical protein IAI10_22535 [Clostridium sp. 19966]|uniref:hypothetical protein n=1 Tax=Clostridium sp. 19966 TaxID=2768166 RepID=UPI0028DEC5BC|nr:hypothetical protein [Clostridium sp. 19966]MDT8719433.1 hypothetical protein [Clostridium sp. 19966]